MITIKNKKTGIVLYDFPSQEIFERSLASNSYYRHLMDQGLLDIDGGETLEKRSKSRSKLLTFLIGIPLIVATLVGSLNLEPIARKHELFGIYPWKINELEATENCIPVNPIQFKPYIYQDSPSSVVFGHEKVRINPCEVSSLEYPVCGCYPYTEQGDFETRYLPSIFMNFEDGLKFRMARREKEENDRKNYPRIKLDRETGKIIFLDHRETSRIISSR